jgi:hypothetical protein
VTAGRGHRPGAIPRLLAVLGAVGALALATAGPAAAHAGDPTLVTRLHRVTPALPDQVSVVLQTTIADELVVTNPTATPLVVLDADGAEFLRVSASGVQGNETSPYFHLTTVPPDVRVAVPPSARAGAAPVWVPLSAAPTWTFFDPRMSPATLQVPVGGRQEVEQVEQLAAWSVPLRYGDQPVSVEGALERRPVTGRFETSLDPAPAGISAVVAQGYVPSISVQATAGHEVTVFGRDGRPFLRSGSDGAQLDRGSPTHRDDVLARGRPLAGDDTGWIRLPGSGTTWADVRLRFPAEDPPAELADATTPVDVGRWEIPVVVDGAPQALSGTIRWLPNARTDGGSSWTAVGLVGVAALLVAGGAALALRSRRMATTGVDGDRDREELPEYEPQRTH